MAREKLTVEEERLATALLALCRHAAGLSAWPAAEITACGDPDALGQLARAHGIAGALYPVEGTPASGGLSPELLAVWKGWRMAQFARSAAAVRELRELSLAFRTAGIPFVALKGAAALTWLHPDPALRSVIDLDLLAPEDSLGPAQATLEGLGYALHTTYTSEEDARAIVARWHLPAMVRRESLPVEVHAHFIRPRQGRRRATEALWRDAVPAEVGGAPLLRPSWPHFLLQTAAHLSGHLDEGRIELKWMTDLLRVLQRHASELDGAALRAEASAWGVERPVFRALATAGALFSVSAPGRLESDTPYSVRDLVFGRGGLGTGRAGPYLRKLSAAGELPDLASRARYLWGLAFPSAECLRDRYDLPADAPVGEVHVRRLRELPDRIFRSRQPRKED